MGQAAYWAHVEGRLVDWLVKALRRKPAAEPQGAAALRVAAPHCAKLRKQLVVAAQTLIRRRSYGRPLYGAVIRSLADQGDRQLPGLLASALADPDGGGLSTLAAAARCRSPKLGAPLMRLMGSRRVDLAFGAELVCRLRADGRPDHLLDAAARLKESSRILLCTQLLAPMVTADSKPVALPRAVAPAMGVLRNSERHLGRWLVFAKVGMRGGDPGPLEEADKRACHGTRSSRAAWTLLAWALAPQREVPSVKATTDIVARLSDRPTAERDLSFLFLLARVGATGARPMLEVLAKPPLREAVHVRGAGVLARCYDDGTALSPLRAVADGRTGHRLRGVAVAALWDAGQQTEACQRAAVLQDARSLSCSVWGGLVLGQGRSRTQVMSESSFRLLEPGWVE
ncbi:MAG: hypothetical protein DRI90_08945 [Deltaproteobacteria bacterium]|nr:MAG: hypothetical protein DRI90_08945 [Deltaproteobacteria bacterium]